MVNPICLIEVKSILTVLTRRRLDVFIFNFILFFVVVFFCVCCFCVVVVLFLSDLTREVGITLLLLVIFFCSDFQFVRI